MIRYDSPWVASVGATKKPMYRPIAASAAKAAQHQGISAPARP